VIRQPKPLGHAPDCLARDARIVLGSAGGRLDASRCMNSGGNITGCAVPSR